MNSSVSVSQLKQVDSRFQDIEPIRSDEICLHPTTYPNLFKRTFKSAGYRPWKRGIVLVRLNSNEGKDQGQRVYRRFRGVTSIDADEGVVSFSTLRELHTERIVFNADLKVIGMSPIKGRLLFYLFHPDDSSRVGFKLGLLSVTLGLVGLGIGLLGLIP